MRAKPTGKLIGYARVSTDDQDLRMQVAALEKAGCWNIWKEKRSATRGPRPELENALLDLREGDTLLVWKLDRLVRNTADAYKLLAVIEEKGCIIRSLTEPNIEGRKPIDRFVFGLTALLAQLEVDRTSERTAAGIKALQDQGYLYGARPKLSPKEAARLVRLRTKAGWSIPALAVEFRVSTATAQNYIRRAAVKKTGKHKG